MHAFYERYRRFNDRLEFALVAFAGLVVAVIVALPVVSAVTRLITGQGYSFLDETAPQLVPWMVFPMLGVLLRKDGHITVDMLLHVLKGRALTILRIVVLAVSLLASIAIGVMGYRTTVFFAGLGQMSTTEIEFPLWYLYLSYPLGFFLAANFCLESLIGEALGRREHDQLAKDTS
ncbi:MAG: TRAP transporter small permease [Lautropia sp.]